MNTSLVTVTGLSSGAFAFGHLIGMPPVAVSDTIKVNGTPFTVTGVMINSPQDPATQDGYYEITVAESTSGLSDGDPVTAQGEILLPQDRAHSAANEITYVWPPGSTNPGYDGAGNMTLLPAILGAQPAAWELTWDAWNRLVEISDLESETVVARYAYDGLTRRVTKETDFATTPILRHFYYSNRWQVIEERVDGAGLPDRQFFWGVKNLDDLVYRQRFDGTGIPTERLWALNDGKNVTAIAEDNTIQERYEYEAFGAPEVLDSDFVPREDNESDFEWETRFCGYRWDEESSISQVRYRYYQPHLGRWVSRDPIEEFQFRVLAELPTLFYWSTEAKEKLFAFDAAAVESNVFSYVRNSAPSMVDPTGLKIPGQVCVSQNCRGADLSNYTYKAEEDPEGDDILRHVPTPGRCVDADALYHPGRAVKIPDGRTITITCCKDGSVCLVYDLVIPVWRWRYRQWNSGDPQPEPRGGPWPGSIPPYPKMPPTPPLPPDNPHPPR